MLVKIYETFQDIKWIAKQTIASIKKQPLKGYKKTLNFNEILYYSGLKK